MIKRWVVAVSFIALVAMGLVPPPGDAAPRAAMPLVSGASAVPVGASFVIEPPMADYVRELDQREHPEQIRDWAVLGTLTRLGATAEQLALATYESPPARLAYLDELYSFEYGPGRRAYLGNRVLLFRDRDDFDPQATIGRLADQARRESGELPAAIELYLIDHQRDLGTIRIERAPDLARDQLFSRGHGYVTGEVRDVRGLTEWLEQVDDLTSARFTRDGRLLVGGRRFSGTRTANITAEDVAAIYQAHQLLDKRRLEAIADLEALPPILGKDIVRFVDLMYRRTDGNLRAAAGAAEAALDLLSGPQRDRVSRSLAIALDGNNSPGFSLDPEWVPDPGTPQHPLMLARLRAFAEDPCSELARTALESRRLVQQEPDEARRTTRTVAAQHLLDAFARARLEQIPPSVCAMFKAWASRELAQLSSTIETLAPSRWERGMSPYYEFLESFDQRLTKDINGLFAWLTYWNLSFYEQDTRVQCARYEGLAGTRVGMTLFYTDLLAKLWVGVDFGRSAPIAGVPGFLSYPQLDLSTSPEEVEKRGTRLWFGARPGGVSRVDQPDSLAFLFDHQFSRIYAAGHDLVKPEAETQPGDGMRRVLGWWDRHFNDIANYEQEYHRQNQIMKWALITTILDHLPLGRELANVAVSRDLEFVEWRRSNHYHLRFSGRLPAVTQGIAGKECVPLFASYSFPSAGRTTRMMGGVSTVSRAAPRLVPPTNVSKPLGARTPPPVDLGAGTSGTATRARPVLDGSSVTFKDATLARPRDANGPVELGEPVVDYIPGGRPGAVAVKAGRGPAEIGEVRSEIGKNGVAMQWTDGPVERFRLRKLEPLDTTVGTADHLAKQGKVVDAAHIYEAAPRRALSEVDQLARDVVIDVARHRPAAVAAKLERLAVDGKVLSPDARQALLGAVARDSAPVARQLETAWKRGTPLNHGGASVGVDRGRVVLTRDIEQLATTPRPVEPRADLSSGVVYLDTRLRVGREGLQPDLGGSAARWQAVRGVKLRELKADSIGALPDRIVEKSTGTAFARDMARPLPTSGPVPRIYVLQSCDADKKTASTRDDC